MRYAVHGFTVKVANWTTSKAKESPPSVIFSTDRTLVRSSALKFPCDLHVPSPADPMTTQSPTLSRCPAFGPTFVTLATPSFPPTATGGLLSESCGDKDETGGAANDEDGVYSRVVIGGLRG